MWGLHLKKKGRWWHYYRSVPRNFHDVDARRLISFSLKTSDFAEAKLKAARFSIQLDEEWLAAKTRGVSLVSQDAVEKYKAAAEIQKSFGFTPKPCTEMLEVELVERWETRRQAEGAIFQYINGFYNPRRRYSSLGGKSPLAFERKVA